MDWTSILATALTVVILFFLRRWLAKLFGFVGEKMVAVRLKRLPKDRYRVLNDVILSTGKTSTTQIDHLVVSVYGIFVIETKNYTGWIYGKEGSEYWTQNLYGNKTQFYNPVLQNAGHIRSLRWLLAGFTPLNIYSIVAFSGSADLRVSVKEAFVIYWRQVRSTIASFQEPRLSPEQVDAICEKIQSVRIRSTRKTRRQHVQNVKAAQKKKAADPGRCPRCGGKLVVRNGKYGRFYGCSNYPHCRYTQ
jgi:hypothetical protein